MMDFVLELWVTGIIESSKVAWMLGNGQHWKPGHKLKLLFAGYNGTRNTGSDLRVEEIIRQVRQILGDENIELTVMTQNFDNSRGYFGNARQVHLPDVFPPFLRREVPRHDGVIACEGSMFKSRWANALTAMMIGSLGIAAARNKLSVAYGAEADEMDPLLQKMCRRYCAQSLVIARSVESQAVLGRLGIPTELGTDTAWTFEPLGPEYAHKVLRSAGWDGRTPILALCPINAFWWPVRPSLVKAAAHTLTGAYEKSHYRSLYFHRSGSAVDAAYERYLSGIARAVERYRKTIPIFPIVVGTEMLDRDACHRLAVRLGGAPVFTSDRYDMYQLVSLLRASHRLVSSRYHAIITTMPAGVVSAGITMDERICNLMRERGHDHLLLTVDDSDLEDKVFDVLQTLDRDADSIRQAIGVTVSRNLRLMARMGTYFEELVARHYPEFPIRTGVRSWEEYLPSMSPNLYQLLETFA